MHKWGEKRGLSTIVATLIIIMLVLVAVGVVWATISNVVYKSSEQINLGKFTVDLNIENPQVMCSSLNITVKRNHGEGSFVGIAFVFEGGDTSETIKEYVSMEELEERSFNFTLKTLTSENITAVKVYPIFRLQSGKEMFGNAKNKHIFSDSDILECPLNASLNITANSTIPIDSCGVLNRSGIVYVLTSDVTSSGTCFNITAENVALDCDNNWVTYSTGGAQYTYGIYTNQFNSTIINCNVLDGNWTNTNSNRAGILLNTSDNSTLLNNFVNGSKPFGIYLMGGANYNTLAYNTGISDGNAIYLSSSSNNVLTSNTVTSRYGNAIYLSSSSNNVLTSNTVTSRYGGAIYLSSSSNNVLTSNTGTCTIGTNDYSSGIYTYQSSNNIFINNIGTSNQSYAISLSSSSNNILINNTGTSNATDYVHSGIYLDYSLNNTLTSNTGIGNTGAGISLNLNNSNLTSNMGIANKGTGMGILGSYNNLINNTAISLGGGYVYGMALLGSYNNLINNTAICTGTSGYYCQGFYMRGSSNCMIIGLTARALGTTPTTYGVYVQESNNTIFEDCIISGVTKDVYIDSYRFQSVNNTFINCSYNTEDVRGDPFYSFGLKNELIRKWYYQANVKNSSNNPLSEANVFAFNTSGIQQFTTLTDSSGFINRQEVIEYVNIGGTRSFYNNYVINASKAGYITGTHTFINFTVQQNKMNDVFTLSSGGYGLLYNWYVVNDSRNIANVGWHVPSQPEMLAFRTFLGGTDVAGGKIKEIGFAHWSAPNGGATDAYGFGMRGSGNRQSDGTFANLKWTGNMWLTTIGIGSMAWIFGSYYNYDDLTFQTWTMKDGLIIRLIKDSTTLTDGQTGTYTGNDGKSYRTICINGQEWLAENLVETRYRNGDTIPEVTSDAAWAALTTGALCAYNNDWNYV